MGQGVISLWTKGSITKAKSLPRRFCNSFTCIFFKNQYLFEPYISRWHEYVICRYPALYEHKLSAQHAGWGMEKCTVWCGRNDRTYVREPLGTCTVPPWAPSCPDFCCSSGQCEVGWVLSSCCHVYTAQDSGQFFFCCIHFSLECVML